VIDDAVVDEVAGQLGRIRRCPLLAELGDDFDALEPWALAFEFRAGTQHRPDAVEHQGDGVRHVGGHGRQAHQQQGGIGGHRRQTRDAAGKSAEHTRSGEKGSIPPRHRALTLLLAAHHSTGRVLIGK
jgi:hypothetical protein